MRTRVLVVAVSLALLLPLSSASAQTVWPPPYRANQISVEGVASDFADGSVAFPSGSGYLTITHSITENVELVGELPAGRYAADTDSSSVSQTTLGNPYLGIGLTSTDVPVLIELGVRLPLASDNLAARAGRLSSAGRTQAFVPETELIGGFANTRLQIGEDSSLRLRAGLALSAFSTFFVTSSDKQREVNAHYQAQYWSEGDRFITGLSFAGRTQVLAEDAYGFDRQHYVVGSFIANTPGVRPGVFVGIPIEASIRDVAPFFFGVTLSTSYAD
jgi:hypothetical protein